MLDDKELVFRYRPKNEFGKDFASTLAKLLARNEMFLPFVRVQASRSALARGCLSGSSVL